MTPRDRVLADPTGRQNMMLLVQLRWLAVFGQLVTILVVWGEMGADLPIAAMGLVLAGLVALNVASVALLRGGRAIGRRELFAAMLLDVASLTAQLYLSGGATNPFVSLFLLQVVLGAVLLDGRASWALVATAILCFVGVALFHRPLRLPDAFVAHLPDLQVLGAILDFALVAVLLVVFVTRITANLTARDRHLAAMREQAAEEDHVVRIGLLASGAAHELGTPLAQLSVIVGDWKRMPALAALPGVADEVAEMEGGLARCKAIVSGILLAAGEAPGRAPARTTVRGFLRTTADEWSALHPGVLRLDDAFGEDAAIVADPALRQVVANVLDNAVEAGAQAVTLAATREAAALLLAVSDDGPGFAPAILAELGRPYRSTKDRAGSGLGLFLAVNVMRKLGGRVAAHNRTGGGATVTLALPLAALAIGAVDD